MEWKVSEKQVSGRCCLGANGVLLAWRTTDSQQAKVAGRSRMQKSTLSARLPHRRYARRASPAVACSSVATAQVRQRCTMPSAADCNGEGRRGS